MKVGKKIQVYSRWNNRNHIYHPTWNNQEKKKNKISGKYCTSGNKGQWSQGMGNKINPINGTGPRLSALGMMGWEAG